MQEVWKKYAASKGEHPFNAETTIDFLDPNNPKISFNYTCLNTRLIDYYTLEKMEDTAYFSHLFAQYLAMLVGFIHFFLIFRPVLLRYIDYIFPYLVIVNEQLIVPAVIIFIIVAYNFLFLAFFGWDYVFGTISKYLHNRHKWFRDHYAEANAMFRLPLKHKINLAIPSSSHKIIVGNILIYFKVSHLQFDLVIPDEILSKIKMIRTVASTHRESLFARNFYLIIEFSEIPKEGIIELWG